MAIPVELPRTITRNRGLIKCVLGELTADLGVRGRAAQAGRWALTGSVDSPITRTPAVGCPPTREEVLVEVGADPVGSTAPPGVPTDFCDQTGEARHLLRWLIGETDEIPVDDDNRGRFIGARDDYARTDGEIRDRAFRGLRECDLPNPMDPDQARHPWHWSPGWMNAAWLHDVRDLLTWVLGEDRVSPLSEHAVCLPTVHDLSYEETGLPLVAWTMCPRFEGNPGVSAGMPGYAAGWR